MIYCCSVAKSYRTFCDPTDCRMPGCPVLHSFPEYAQTHVHLVSDAIKLPHPLLPSSPATLILSQHQSFPTSRLFASGGQSIGASFSASVLPKNIQSLFPLELTGLISLLSNGLSRISSSTTIQKHLSFFVIQLLHQYITTGKTRALTRQTFFQSDVSAFKYAI